MLPVHPEYVCVDVATGDDVLAAICFGLEPCRGMAIGARQLGPSPLVEVWRSPLPVTRGRCSGVSFAANGSVMMGNIAVDGGETEIVTARVYEQLVDGTRCAGYPHLLRVWNHVGGINADDRNLERYKRFSAGRYEALTSRGYAAPEYPAASAIGVAGEGVAVYFIASRTPGLQVENPRQVAAYEYPPAYGPRSPSFARATVAEWDGGAMIFVAGTSSVVGHTTQHAGDVGKQLDETLRNVGIILCEAAARAGRSASLDDVRTVKTYLRRAADFDVIAPRVLEALPRAQHLFLEADICRRDLLLEIEAVAVLQ